MPLRQDNGGDAGVQVLTVSIVAGRNLKAMDIIGTSDPYCIVKVGRNKYQTRCYYETCHPVWREVAEFREPDLRDSLVVEVWDKDLTSDDMIGQVVIPLQQLVGFDMVAPRWYGLNDFDDEPVGEVLLRLKLPRPPGDGVGDKSTVQQVAWAEFELFQHGAKTSLKIGRTPRTTARLMTPEAAAAAGAGGGGGAAEGEASQRDGAGASLPGGGPAPFARTHTSTSSTASDAEGSRAPSGQRPASVSSSLRSLGLVGKADSGGARQFSTFDFASASKGHSILTDNMSVNHIPMERIDQVCIYVYSCYSDDESAQHELFRDMCAPIGQVTLDLSKLAIGGVLDAWLDVHKLDEDHEIDKYLAQHQIVRPPDEELGW